MKMSMARYNDLVYLGLKYGWFRPLFGDNAGPRQCDIRVCMQMGCAEMLKGAGVEAAILWPDEMAPVDHNKMVEVDTLRVLTAMKVYMEDHWMKQHMGKEWWEWVAKEVWPNVIEAAMKTPEKECAKESPLVQPEA
jgi:hypothetical protein